MSSQDRVRWDAIYADRSRQPFPPPDPLLLSYTPHVPESQERRALDLASGLGQNGLWLAAPGYTADLMDISRVALSRARMELAARNLRNVNLLQMDVDDLLLEDQAYDLICVFRYLKRSIIPTIRAAVAPQGRVVYESYNIRYLEQVPDFNTAFLLNLGELLGMFQGWKIIHYVEDDHISQIVAVNIPGDSHDYDDLATNPIGDW